MRDPPFDPSAAKQTVSVTPNTDLDIQVQMDLTAAERYAEEHGSFADRVREHYERGDAV